jgi:hypothetical protein
VRLRRIAYPPACTELYCLFSLKEIGSFWARRHSQHVLFQRTSQEKGQISGWVTNSIILLYWSRCVAGSRVSCAFTLAQRSPNSWQVDYLAVEHEYVPNIFYRSSIRQLFGLRTVSITARGRPVRIAPVQSMLSVKYF